MGVSQVKGGEILQISHLFQAFIGDLGIVQSKLFELLQLLLHVLLELLRIMQESLDIFYIIVG